MAGEIESVTGIDMSGVGNAVSTAGNAVFYFMIFAAVCSVIVYFMWFTSFNQTITLKKVVNGMMKRKTLKCKTVTKKDGQSYLQIRNSNPTKKETHPAPPMGVIEMGDRGKEFITGYITETGELIYTRDTGTIPQIPKEFLEISDYTERYKKIKEWKQANNVIEPYKPITTVQRTFYLNQIKQGNSKAKLTLMDRIQQMAPFMALVIMFAIMLIFGGKLYEPATQLAEQVIVHDRLVLQMQEKTDNIDKNVQKLVTEKGVVNNQPPPPQ